MEVEWYGPWKEHVSPGSLQTAGLLRKPRSWRDGHLFCLAKIDLIWAQKPKGTSRGFPGRLARDA